MWNWLCTFTVAEVTSIIQAGVVVIVAIPTFLGLNSWRLQVLGKKKIDLAEEALALSYELQSIIEWVRHPASFGGEGQDRDNRDQEPEARQRLNDAYYSRISRLNESKEEFARLRSLRPVFRAYFGSEAQDALMDFVIVRNQINTAVGMLINHTDEDDYPQEIINKYEDIIWG